MQWINGYNPPKDQEFSWSTCDMQMKVCNAMKYIDHSDCKHYNQLLKIKMSGFKNIKKIKSKK